MDKRSNIGPVLILGSLFFIFGFVTWLNSTLIPYLRISCELKPVEAMLVAFAFYISYFVMSLPASKILERTGFKKGMMLGLVVMALGALIFVPAALSRIYALFLLGLFIIGTGLALLQTASNPYVTIVGPIESAAKRISIMGIANKIAGVLAPIILGAVILNDADSVMERVKTASPELKNKILNELAAKAILPYCLMALVLVGLAVMLYFSSLPEIEQENEEDEKDITSDILKQEHTSIFQFPNLILGALGIFLYVGAEVVCGDTIILYGQSMHIPLQDARIFTSYTLAGMVIGYIIGIVMIPKIITQAKALSMTALLGILVTGLALTSEGYESILFIASLGIANALVWPAIWPLAIHGLGKFTKTGSAILVMCIAGGAVMPLLYAQLANTPSIGFKNAYWLLIPIYAYIFFYAVKGHKIFKW